MKDIFKTTSCKNFICLFFIVFLFATARAEVNPKPFVVPELKSWKGAEGCLHLSKRIVCKGKKERIVAESLAADYQAMFGERMSIVTGAPSVGDIVISLSIRGGMLEGEAYCLEIGTKVEINATTLNGLYWGTRTLLQICEQSEDHALPCGRTIDNPEYGLRGFMIDCGRKYIPISYLRNLVKVMAYYKMNTLQIHLNDNGFRQFFGNDWSKTQAAFRLECETFPGLTAKDGSYSKKEFVELQKLAENNFVEIIPEIDVPAHSLAFSHYRPSLGSKEYGMDHLDLSNKSTYEFLDSLFAEYIGGKEPIFRGPKVHIGTDEYSNARQDVVEQFRAFTDHYIRYVERFGKKAVVWGALTHAKGSTPVKAEGVLMNCWYNGYADPSDMKKLGYSLISIPDGLVYIVPASGYYYDYLNCEYLYNNWTPATIGERHFEENDPAIEGGMFAVWNDHAGNGITVKDIHHRVMPALQTMATKCWTGKNTSLPYAEFDSLRRTLSEAPGVNELARHGKKGQVVLQRDILGPGDTLSIKEIGYNYAVTFTIDGEDEAYGTKLFQSENAIFYLSSPESGKLGFEREGYLNTFNYRIEKGVKATLTIEGDNRSTRLYINGQLLEELSPITLYAVKQNDLAKFQKRNNLTWLPQVYTSADKMYYQRTLVFPLHETGNFRSHITRLKVIAK